MKNKEQSIAIFVPDINKLDGHEVPLSKVPAQPQTGRAIVLQARDIKPSGAIHLIAGTADSVDVSEHGVTFRGVTLLEIPIVLGFDGDNLRPDLIPKKGWGPSDFVYVPVGTAARVEAEVARLVAARDALESGGEHP